MRCRAAALVAAAAGPLVRGRADQHMDLERYLDALADGGDAALASVLKALARACAEVADALRATSDGQGGAKAGTHNVFGDEQLRIDALSDQIFFNRLLQVQGDAVAVVSSEETPREVRGNGSRYCVALDPLDGSSIYPCNFSVGSIFGVWRGGTLIGQRGRDLVAAGCAVYGPRTQLVIAVRQHGDSGTVSEFALLDGARWARSNTYPRDAIGAVGAKLFSPGNLRAAQEIAGYNALVQYWLREQYTLRYTGGMVSDVYQLLVKGAGVFCNASRVGKAKLRLVYELLPMAFIVECAGGASSDGAASLMERKVESLLERCQVCLGTREEVQRFERMVGSSPP